MATINGTSVGYVQSEVHTKDSNLFQQPIPTSDSSSSILLDLFGVTKNISVTGTFTGSLANINTFISAIETIENGSQSGVTWVSSLSTYGNKTVFIKSFSWTYATGSPLKINYQLELTEGASVA